MIPAHFNGPKLSIVILSMNNIVDLEVCLSSILNNSNFPAYELILVAYKFSDSNLDAVRTKFPQVEIIESNGIRGFSENNNLALKSVKGEFVMVLNDDTYFDDRSIDNMLEFMINNPQIKLLSPHILNFDGTSQILGWPKYTVKNYFLHELKLGKLANVGDKQQPLFQTNSVSGACFMIDAQLLKDIGFFDEKYYFTPEDIALSAKCAYKGFPPFVWQNAKVYHKGSSTAKKIHQVTIPVAKQGIYLYFREFYGVPSEIVVRAFITSVSFLKLLYWLPKKSTDRKTVMINANWNCIKYAFASPNTKSLFTKLLNEVNK